MGLFDHLYNLDWTAHYPLQYYYNDGRHVTFDKYTIDMFGGIYNKKTSKPMRYYKNGDGYNAVSIRDHTGKQCGILVARSMVSTFQGNPPTLEHTTEHIDCTNKNNDIISELTWIIPSGQNKNRIQPEVYLSAYIVIRNEIEMTTKEWVKYLIKEKNILGRKYTENMIKWYAQKKLHGFTYKTYDDLPNETWYKVANSVNTRGHWEISDQNRLAYVTTYARNVIDATRFGFSGKYPKITINGKQRLLHDMAFETFYPNAYAAKLSTEMILHKNDDKLDFRPHMLYIGDASMNTKDSYDNGCHDNTKTARQPCCSYVNGVLEKRYESLKDAVDYLKANGYAKARHSPISEALEAFKKRKILTKYGRTWNSK
jgi:hypothetical protein